MNFLTNILTNFSNNEFITGIFIKIIFLFLFVLINTNGYLLNVLSILSYEEKGK